MKNFTLIALCAMLFSTGSLVAQPTTAPAAPTKAASDVISILSAAYTPLAANFTPAVPAVGINFFPSWGQGTTFSEFPVGGDPIKKYAALDYEGIDFGGALNASGMTTLHWDIFTDVVTTLQIFPITGQPEKSIERTTMVGWNSFDIPLTEFTAQGLSMSSIIQFKFQEKGFVYHGGTKTVYLDNIYFWKPSNIPSITGFTVPAKLVGDASFALTPPTSNSSGAFTYMSSDPNVATVSGSTVTIVGAGTSTITANQAAASPYLAGSTSAVLTVSYAPPATVAPTPPVRTATDVLSIYSDAYSNLPDTDFYPFWGQPTPVGFTDITVSGDNIKGYKSLSYQGTQFANAIDVSTYQYLHVDLWSPNCAAFDFYLIGGGEQKVTLTPNSSGWNSFEIPMSSYNAVTLTGIIQFKFVATGTTAPTGSSSTVYVDNIYFYKAVVVPPAVPTVAAPTPTNPIPNVISLYSGAYTDPAGTNWNIYNGGSGGSGATGYSEVMIDGNATQKYDNLGYSVTEMANINATPATTLHVDVWTSSAADFKVKLVDFGANGIYQGMPNDDSESELSFTTNAGTWTSLDIPLANFTTLAARAHLRQFVISTATLTGGRILAPPSFYVDNIYFYANVALAVELTNFNAKSINKTTVLNWQTASEKDNQGFTVERSLNGTDYAAIGQVKGNGTTNTVRNYAFTDVTPANGVNYYRLRQTDLNGKEALSKVVSVISGKNFLVLKNTLVQNLLDVTVGEESKTPLSIFNVSGQLVYSAKVQGNQLLDVSALTSGLYIVRTEMGDVSRFVKE
jgi:hypothetical protein